MLACFLPEETHFDKMLGRGSSRKSLEEDDRHFKSIHFMVGKPFPKMFTNNAQSEPRPEGTTHPSRSLTGGRRVDFGTF